MDNRMSEIMSSLTQTEIENIYRMQKRAYWEMDFVDRCIDRKLESVGLCNLPYDTLEDEETILDTAYELYCKIADCNIAYNDTLNAIAYEIERYIARTEKGADS